MPKCLACGHRWERTEAQEEAEARYEARRGKRGPRDRAAYMARYRARKRAEKSGAGGSSSTGRTKDRKIQGGGAKDPE